MKLRRLHFNLSRHRGIALWLLAAGLLRPVFGNEKPADLIRQPVAKAPDSQTAPASAASEPALPAAADSTNSPSPASQLDPLISANLTRPKWLVTKAPTRLRTYREQLDLAHELRRKPDRAGAAKVFVELLENETPAEFKRAALFELALIAEEENRLSRAQQILAQYLHLFPKDRSVPEVILRQGLIYRQMGANQLALSKFYAVMSSALNMKLAQLDYYARLVLQAQTEIADTHYLQGQFSDAAELYTRLLKQGSAELNRQFIHCKLLRCLATLNQHASLAAQAEAFEHSFPESSDLAEVRFLHAQSLKHLGHMRESLEQISKLLEAQQSTATNAPEIWAYWHQRVGNEIANQLYQEGDYLNALELYTLLAQLDSSPAWQLPAMYQIGLIHERLNQPEKAAATFDAILAREKELTGLPNMPSLKAVIEMAKWRKDHLSWQGKAEMTMQSLRLDSLHRSSTNTPTLANP
jgi:tetratricopeptide (TPR) repeat protein